MKIIGSIRKHQGFSFLFCSGKTKDFFHWIHELHKNVDFIIPVYKSAEIYNQNRWEEK